MIQISRKTSMPASKCYKGSVSLTVLPFEQKRSTKCPLRCPFHLSYSPSFVLRPLPPLPQRQEPKSSAIAARERCVCVCEELQSRVHIVL